MVVEEPVTIYQRGVNSLYVLAAVIAVPNADETVIVELVPIVFDRIVAVVPALGPPVMCTV